MIVILEKCRIYRCDVEIESIGDAAWLQTAALDPLDDRQDRNASPLDVRPVENIACDAGVLP